jgi:hypothetical protein
MAGFIPAIHVKQCCTRKGVDGRDKPGHDETLSRNHLMKKAGSFELPAFAFYDVRSFY